MTFQVGSCLKDSSLSLTRSGLAETGTGYRVSQVVPWYNQDLNKTNLLWSIRKRSNLNENGLRYQLTQSLASWFHTLCKNINVERSANGHAEIVNQNKRSGTQEEQSQADYSWLRSGFFLQCEPDNSSKVNSALQRNDSGNNTNKAAGNGDGSSSRVTLLCFGASQAMEMRFQRLIRHHSWMDALDDPYVLFDIVLDELYMQLDNVAWSLGEVFGGIEGVST
jgi:hypothetical protein